MNKRIPNCYLHIGLPKTATTYLQTVFANNRSVLLQKGIYYAKSLGRCHHKLTILSQAVGGTNKFRHKMYGIDGDQSLSDFQESVRRKIADEMSSLPEHTQSVVFSDEGLSYGVRKVEEILRLRDFLSEYFDNIYPILYIRRQDELFCSFLSTWIRNGLRNVSFESNLHLAKIGKGRLYVFQFRKIIQKYVKVYGADSLKVKIFGNNKNILEEFCEIVGLKTLEGFDLKMEHGNESFSHKGQKLYNIINMHLPSRSNALRHEMNRFFQKYHSGKGELLSRDEAEKFYGVFKSDNEWIRGKFFPDKPCGMLFDLNFSKYPDERPQVEITPDDVASTMASFLKELDYRAFFEKR